MIKEIIIIFMVLVLVVSLDIIINNYTSYAADELSNKLYTLRENIISKDKENIDKQVKEIDTIWDEYNKKLSYYMEHDELEKVGRGLTALKAHIDMQEYKESIENLDETVFILQHIEEKEKFSVGSLF